MNAKFIEFTNATLEIAENRYCIKILNENMERYKSIIKCFSVIYNKLPNDYVHYQLCFYDCKAKLFLCVDDFKAFDKAYNALQNDGKMMVLNTSLPVAIIESYVAAWDSITSLEYFPAKAFMWSLEIADGTIDKPQLYEIYKHFAGFDNDCYNEWIEQMPPCCAAITQLDILKYRNKRLIKNY